MLNLEYFVNDEPIKFLPSLFDGRLLATIQFVASMDNFVKESQLEFCQCLIEPVQICQLE